MYSAALLDPNEDASAATSSMGGDLSAGSSSGGALDSAAGADAGGAAGSTVASGGVSNAGSSNGGASQGGALASAGKGGVSAAGSTGAGGTLASGGSSAGSAGNGGATGSAGAPGVDPCSRSNWTASASESSLSTTTPQLYNPPADAIDNDGSTRWSTGMAQVGGEWFRIDLGAIAAHLTQIVLDTSNHPTDFPVNYKLELSTDGTNYTFKTSGSGSSITTIGFVDSSARYIRVTQTGADSSWWSIQEVSISCQSN